jgi:hypothetical protein
MAPTNPIATAVSAARVFFAPFTLGYHVEHKRDRPCAKRHIRERRVQRMPKPSAAQKVLDLPSGNPTSVESLNDDRLRGPGGPFKPVLPSNQIHSGL